VLHIYIYIYIYTYIYTYIYIYIYDISSLRVKVEVDVAVPILCYGSVTWTLTQTSEQMLNMFQRKILRRIYGPTHERGCWRPRWNNELYSLYKEPNIVEDTKLED